MKSSATRNRRYVLLASTAAALLTVAIYRDAPDSADPVFDESAAATLAGTGAESRWPALAAREPSPANASRESMSTPLPADTESDTVAHYASEKYELLLEDIDYLPADRFEQLNRALLKRELLAGRPGTQTALAEADADIRAMLRPTEQAKFDSLRESDAELFHLNEFAGGVGNVAPLSADDRKSILETKLAHKDRFRQMVADSGLLRADLSAAEREYAFRVASRALEDYRRNYLLEVRQYLSNDEQFALLSNFESTEFSAELVKLRERATGS